MKIDILCRNAEGAEKTFVYDNLTGRLSLENGIVMPVAGALAQDRPARRKRVTPFSKDEPVKKGEIRTLKIQLGLSCNYACTYCSQRFVPRADETSRKNLPAFLEKLDRWMKTAPKRVEFWGGEPLVYVKTLMPLAEAIKERYPNAELVMITNGSLLNPEINQWLDDMDFAVGISHDGPGQFVRGPDPLDNPKQREAILDLYRRLSLKGKVSFNTMINRQNIDRRAVQEFFIKLTGNPHVRIGEGAIIDVYDEGGAAMGIDTREEHLWLRRQTLEQLREGAIDSFGITHSRMQEMFTTLAYGRDMHTVGTKCGMERPENISVDLRGDVTTCQNVSSASYAPNGESHKIGNIDDYENVSLNTSTHWSRRDYCGGCPVLQLCKSSCMFLEGDLFKRSCENSFTDHIAFWARAIEVVTGYLPYRIEAEHLPEERRDIWGEDVGEIELPKRKPGVVPRSVPATAP